jgi:hypothetical protein
LELACCKLELARMRKLACCTAACLLTHASKLTENRSKLLAQELPCCTHIGACSSHKGACLHEKATQTCEQAPGASFVHWTSLLAVMSELLTYALAVRCDERAPHTCPRCSL